MSLSKLTSTSLLLFSYTAFAVPDSSLFDLSLEELLQVEVTSTSSVATTRQESAASVVVLQPQNWQLLGSRNLGELMATLPNTSITPGFGASRIMAVRGYLSSSANAGNSVLLDGIPMNSIRVSHAISSIDGYALSSLEKVEMVRGPGSALHGADAFHSVTSLSSIRLPEQSQSKVWLSLGSEHYRSGGLQVAKVDSEQGIVGLISHSRLGDQNLRYQYPEPSSLKPLFSTRTGEQEITNAIVKWRYDRNHLETYVNGYWFDLDLAQLPGPTNASGSLDAGEQDWSDYQSETRALKAGLKWHPHASTTVQTNTYYWDNQDRFAIDRSGVTSPPFLMALEETRQEIHWGMDVTGHYHFSEHSNFSAGYQFRRSKLKSYDSILTFTNNTTSSPLRSEVGHTMDTHSLVLDGRARMSESLFELVYGIRLDDYKSYGLQTSPRLSLLAHLSNTQRALVSYSEAFRKPSLFELFGSPVWVANPELSPETLKTWELDYQHSTNHWLFKSTLFYNKWQQAIQPIVLPSDDEDLELFQHINQGEQRAYGIELGGLGRWDKYEVNFNSSYTRSENISTRQEYSAFPRFMLQLDAGYSVAANWRFFSMVRYHYREHDSEGNVPLPGSEHSTHYLRLDASLSWRPDSSSQYQLLIANLLDRKNYLPGFFGMPKSMPDNGRYINFQGRWEF